MNSLTYIDYLWIGNTSFFIYCILDSFFQLRERLKESIKTIKEIEMAKAIAITTYFLFLFLAYALYYLTFEVFNQHLAFALLFFEMIFRIIRNHNTTKPLVEDDTNRKE